jgi:hypothetical protein
MDQNIFSTRNSPTKEEYIMSPKLCCNCSAVIPYEKYKRKIHDMTRKNQNESSYLFCCSKNCATSVCNRKYPKRTVNDFYCLGNCGKNLGKYWIIQRKYCNDCLVIYRNRNSSIKKDIKDRTLKDFVESHVQKSKSNKYCGIRINAKKIMTRAKKDKCCAKCNYNKHVEICHIKAISEFEENTLISVINDINNLIYLCPNCHWEYDNGLLDIKQTNIKLVGLVGPAPTT